MTDHRLNRLPSFQEPLLLLGQALEFASVLDTDAGIFFLHISATVTKVHIHIFDRGAREDIGLFKWFGQRVTIIGVIGKCSGANDQVSPERSDNADLDTKLVWLSGFALGDALCFFGKPALELVLRLAVFALCHNAGGFGHDGIDQFFGITGEIAELAFHGTHELIDNGALALDGLSHALELFRVSIATGSMA